MAERSMHRNRIGRLSSLEIGSRRPIGFHAPTKSGIFLFSFSVFEICSLRSRRTKIKSSKILSSHGSRESLDCFVKSQSKRLRMDRRDGANIEPDGSSGAAVRTLLLYAP